MNQTNLLQGEKIRLTAVKKEDLPAFAAWFEDTRFARMLDSLPAYAKQPESWEKWLKEVSKGKESFTFAIRLPDKPEIIGFVELEDIQWNHGTGWLAIGLGKETHQGQGYGREAMHLILRYGFHELNLHKIQLTVFSYNERAKKLYESLGFVPEGVYREFLYRDGVRHDMLLYGLLRREWKASN